MAKLTISPKKLEVEAEFSAGNLLIKRLETFGLILQQDKQEESDE